MVLFLLFSTLVIYALMSVQSKTCEFFTDTATLCVAPNINEIMTFQNYTIRGQPSARLNDSSQK